MKTRRQFDALIIRAPARQEGIKLQNAQRRVFSRIVHILSLRVVQTSIARRKQNNREKV